MNSKKCGQCRREQPSSYFTDGRRVYHLCLPCRVGFRKRKENVKVCIHNNLARRCLLCQYDKFDPVIDEAFISYLEYETFGQNIQPAEYTDPLFEELLERLYY